jgi:hypothetical protein
MTVERETSRRSAALIYRGIHESGARQRRTMGEKTRILIFVLALSAVVLLFAAALAPLRRDHSRLLPSVPAGVSMPPLAPPLVPAPSQSPSAVTDPPGFPSSIPTADSPTPPSSPRPAPVVRTVSYEAEAAVNTLTGDARIRPAEAASGHQIIGDIDGEGSTLRFNQVVVPADGAYTVTIYYLSIDDRGLAITVNAAATLAVEVPGTGDLETVGSLTLRLRLRRGANTIEFSNSAARAPDIDRIVVGA